MASVTVAAPAGSHFDFETVKDKQENEWEVPMLIWDDFQKMVEYYGAEGILRIADGTSLRVVFQGAARRIMQAKEPGTVDDIAKAQVEYKPGERRGSTEATPATKAGRAAKKAADARPESADLIAKLLEKIANGEMSAEDLEALV